MNSLRFAWCLFVAGALLATGVTSAAVRVSAQGDLDAFMKQVLERRDDNWRKLQQYVLDERETVEMLGPGHTALWGEQRDYTWYVRDGFFVRSPLKVNGASVGDGDRRKYETEFLEREQRRERRAADPPADRPGDRASAVSPPSTADANGELDGIIRQSRQPQFISSAYFLRFKFDEGRYALVGRETLEGRAVLKIEYYPAALFTRDRRRERREDRGAPDRQREPESSRTLDAQLLQLMNKTSKVTLWVDPASLQIMKYVFDDLGWDFFPGPWLARMSGVNASMTVGEMFPDVWLPRRLDMHVGMLTAAGAVDLQYSLDYRDYRQPDVTTKIGTPDER